MPSKNNKQTPNLAGLRRTRSCLTDIKSLTKEEDFPQDLEMKLQVGAVRNHAERLLMLMDKLESMVTEKQTFCKHTSTVCIDESKFSTTKVCEHCRKVLVIEKLQVTSGYVPEKIAAAV